MLKSHYNLTFKYVVKLDVSLSVFVNKRLFICFPKAFLFKTKPRGTKNKEKEKKNNINMEKNKHYAHNTSTSIIYNIMKTKP